MTDKIANLRFWCTKIIPLVYDDSLSYYEVLCKVTEKLNEVIEVANAGGWTREEIEQFVKDSVDEYLAAIDLPSSADIAQLQTDVTGAQEDIAALADGKMNKLPQDEPTGAIVIVDGTGVASGEVTISEIQESISDASSAAASAASTAGTAVNTANAANTTATSALTAAQNAQNSAAALDANKANKVNGYTESGKILVTGANDKTLVESDKSVGDLLEKKTTSSNAQYVYGFTAGKQITPEVSNGATTGSSIVARYQGRIRCADPIDNADAATKRYVDNAVAGATGGIPVIDFNGDPLAETTSVALYNALSTTGYAIIKRTYVSYAGANPGPVVDGLVTGILTEGGYTFNVLYTQPGGEYKDAYIANCSINSSGSISVEV